MRSEKQSLPATGTVSGYPGWWIALHWLTAGLVLVQLVVNADVRRAFRQRLGGNWDDAAAGAWFHVVTGLLILSLTLMRLALRAIRGAPPPARGVPVVLHLIGAVVHWSLYALLIAMPLSGAVAWFGGVEIAATFHETARLLLIPLVSVHAFGALVEHFVLRNETLLRMLRPSPP